MEKIKVNMSPNPLDIQTIHCSQGDTEAREWGFELHNNGELIDTSDVTEQMFFKAYKGGTEQILPENTSTPTSSPFKGDIKYPQGLLTDQEFLYRESPTEEDGLAKITDIKGNTLVWNQLVPMDWVSTKTFSDGLSVTNNNDGTYTINGTASQSRFPTRNTEIYGIQGHKYYIQLLSSQNKAVLAQNQSTFYINSSAIYTAQSNNAFILYFNANTYNNEKIIPMIIDLTQMFGSGNEPTTIEDFTSLFPLPYYAYNQGTLLSFNGNGIKTVGKNRFNKDTITLNSRIAEDGQIYSSSASDLTDYIDVGAFNSVNFSWDYSSLISSDSRAYVKFDIDKNVVGFATYSPTSKSVNIDTSSCHYLRITLDKGMNDIQVENGQKTSYEPYTSSTLSLPISTYFPTGMKSAGTVYNELTPTKAITRIGAVDLGSLTWTKESRQNRFNSKAFADAKSFPSDSIANGVCAKYITITADDTYFGNDGLSIDSGGRVNIFDTAYTSYTVEQFKSAMSGVYLYYELATPTETSFTTASLVTENAEIPLSNEDGVLIGKCTEQLSENPGFIDAKIKLADADGECYSNKIQLHVERSPQ